VSLLSVLLGHVEDVSHVDGAQVVSGGSLVATEHSSVAATDGLSTVGGSAGGAEA